MNRKEHWETVYRTKRPTEVSWYQAEADLSVRLIAEMVPDHSAPIVDDFHVLTDPVARATHVAQVRHAVPPSGYVLVATFAEDGPTREEHRTPAGALQAFTYCLCRRE